MIAICRPAPLLPLAAMLSREEIAIGVRKLGGSPLQFARMQRTLGRSWGFMHGDRALACAGLMPLPDQDGRRRLECWFAFDPEARSHMTPIMRAAQLTLACAADDALVVARVDQGWRPGERLAQIAGFRRGRVSGGETEWIWCAIPKT